MGLVSLMKELGLRGVTLRGVTLCGVTLRGVTLALPGPCSPDDTM